MKCPHCGEEIQAGKTCEKCGKDAATPRGMEVHYKDFKVTELLDIKMPGPSHTENKVGKPQKEKIIPEDRRMQGTRTEKKGSRLVLVAVLILLAAACGYFLLKLLMKF